MTYATSNNRSRLRLRLAMAAFGCLLALAASAGAELFLRLSSFWMVDQNKIPSHQPWGLPLYRCEAKDSGRECRTADYFTGILADARFLLPKPANVYRVFVMGGSATNGWPFGDRLSFSRFLETGLSAVDKSRRYEVINVGIGAYSSMNVSMAVEEVSGYEPDLVIVYSGNNEYLGMMPADAAGLRGSLRVWSKRRMIKLRLYHLVKEHYYLWTERGAPAPADSAAEPTISALVNKARTFRRISTQRDWFPDDREPVMKRYRANLRLMARDIKRSGAMAMFCTIPVNQSDYPPYEPGPDFPFLGCKPGHDGDWRSDGFDCDRMKAMSIAGGADAPLFYQFARCDFSAGQMESARKHFKEAVDMDHLPRRADSRVNSIIREIAKGEVAFLADLDKIFRDNSPDEIIGDDLIADYVHLSLKGNQLAALAIMETMGKDGLVNLPGDWRGAASAAMSGSDNANNANLLASGYITLGYVAIGLGDFCRVPLYVEHALQAVTDSQTASQLIPITDAVVKQLQPAVAPEQ